MQQETIPVFRCPMFIYSFQKILTGILKVAKWLVLLYSVFLTIYIYYKYMFPNNFHGSSLISLLPLLNSWWFPGGVTSDWKIASLGEVITHNRYPLVNVCITMGKHHFLMGKSNISMAIFNSELLNYQRGNVLWANLCHFLWYSHWQHTIFTAISISFPWFSQWYSNFMHSEISIISVEFDV